MTVLRQRLKDHVNGRNVLGLAERHSGWPSARLFGVLVVGGGVGLGQFGGPERARLPQVDGDENAPFPQN